MSKSYVEYLAADKKSHERIMAKYGVGPVPKSFNGDTSLLSGAPVTIAAKPEPYKPPAPVEEAPLLPGRRQQLALF